jgi:hypothetical protein
MMEAAPALGIWSYAEANETILGVVVGCVMAAAVLFVARRLVIQLRSRRRP